MRVELHNQKGVVGEVKLSGDGVAVPSNAVAKRTIEETTIVEPGDPSKLVTPESGERFLIALAFGLRGSYFWAELVE